MSDVERLDGDPLRLAFRNVGFELIFELLEGVGCGGELARASWAAFEQVGGRGSGAMVEDGEILLCESVRSTIEP